MSFFTWLETTPVGVLMRESPWGFPIGLIFHVWSMAFIVGISVLVVLSVFGFTPRLLAPLLDKFLRVIWTAFCISLASGLLLLCTYPDMVLTSEVFYLKMCFVAVAVSLAVSLRRNAAVLSLQQETPLPLALKLRAGGMLLAWFCAIATGRLLYYTY